MCLYADVNPDGMTREQCAQCVNIECTRKYINIMQDFAECLCFECFQFVFTCECTLVSSVYVHWTSVGNLKQTHRKTRQKKRAHKDADVDLTPTHLPASMRVHTHTHIHTGLLTINLHALPQVSVCVFREGGVTLWRDHTEDGFQLSKHHIKKEPAHTNTNTHVHTHTNTHIRTHVHRTGCSLPVSLLCN